MCVRVFTICYTDCQCRIKHRFSITWETCFENEVKPNYNLNFLLWLTKFQMIKFNYYVKPSVSRKIFCFFYILVSVFVVTFASTTFYYFLSIWLQQCIFYIKINVIIFQQDGPTSPMGIEASTPLARPVSPEGLYDLDLSAIARPGFRRHVSFCFVYSYFFFFFLFLYHFIEFNCV